VEGKRGCGFRKPGGLYLVCDGEGRSCGKLPIVLDRCPVCNSGIKQTRGWTWIDSDRLIATEHCAADPAECRGCPLAVPMGKVGLLWVGKAFYETPQEFSREAAMMGISRRISAIPRDFKCGETWVWLAHPEVVNNPTPPPAKPDTDDEEEIALYEQELAEYRSKLPGVFRVFRPQRVEYVVKGTESDEDIELLVKRGITPVCVTRKGETPAMFDGGGQGRA
jgi:hypothetical protein